MFRNKLLMAFSLLAFAAVLQGAITALALKTTHENVQRARVANELYAGFVELIAQKHQLRLQLTNSLVGISNDPQQRQVFYTSMLRTLDALDNLTEQAHSLNHSDLSKVPEHQQRLTSLSLLRKGVLQVGRIMETEAYARQATSIEEKRELLNNIFDIADGQDLRATLLESINREKLITARDRTAADVSLSFMNNLVLLAAATLVLIAFVLANYFYRALSRPIARLTEGASALRAGNLQYRIPEVGRDEFALLAKSMNEMATEIHGLRHQDFRIKSELEAQVKERTRDFQEALHRLEKVDLRRKQMFADISHELRTPTTAIMGEAQITLRYQTNGVQDYRVALGRIVEYSQSLGRVIDDMLTLARSDIDAFVLERQPVNFKELCSRVVEALQTPLQERKLDLRLNPLPSVWILGDVQRLEQVLRIGLDNAMKYSPSGGQIEVHADLTVDTEGLPNLTLRIRNEGQGITADELPRVFDRHFRGGYAQSVRPDGSGLGLALARTIVRAHRGAIEIQSVENDYTELSITFPVLETTDGEAV